MKEVILVKKCLVFVLIISCILILFGCGQEKELSPRVIHFTIPAGSHELVFSDEELYFADGNVTISADYEVDGIEIVSVWLADTGINHAYEGNPYTNMVILPDSSVEVEVEGERWYKIAVQLINDSENDIPVVITVYDEHWES